MAWSEWPPLGLASGEGGMHEEAVAVAGSTPPSIHDAHAWGGCHGGEAFLHIHAYRRRDEERDQRGQHGAAVFVAPGRNLAHQYGGYTGHHPRHRQIGAAARVDCHLRLT